MKKEVVNIIINKLDEFVSTKQTHYNANINAFGWDGTVEYRRLLNELQSIISEIEKGNLWR